MGLQMNIERVYHGGGMLGSGGSGFGFGSAYPHGFQHIFAAGVDIPIDTAHYDVFYVLPGGFGPFLLKNPTNPLNGQRFTVVFGNISAPGIVVTFDTQYRFTIDEDPKSPGTFADKMPFFIPIEYERTVLMFHYQDGIVIFDGQYPTAANRLYDVQGNELLRGYNNFIYSYCQDIEFLANLNLLVDSECNFDVMSNRNDNVDGDYNLIVSTGGITVASTDSTIDIAAETDITLASTAGGIDVAGDLDVNIDSSSGDVNINGGNNVSVFANNGNNSIGAFNGKVLIASLGVGTGITLTGIKSGATQAAAGAVATEIWRTSGHASLPDGVLMIGL